MRPPELAESLPLIAGAATVFWFAVDLGRNGAEPPRLCP
jgi:hypothetical protein